MRSVVSTTVAAAAFLALLAPAARVLAQAATTRLARASAWSAMTFVESTAAAWRGRGCGAR